MRCACVRFAVFLSVGLAGCLWVCPSLRADPPITASNLWAVAFPKLPIGDISSSTPAVAPDGTIYVGTFKGFLHAYSPEGQLKWSFAAGNEIKSSPAIADDGTIYFGSRDRALYAVTPAGSLKWKFSTGAWVDSSPAIATDGTVYVGSWDRNFYALTPDGSLKWKFPVGAVIDSSPAIGADGTIYFGAHNKKFYALSPAGQPVWTFATGAEIVSSPAIATDGSIYISSTDGFLYHLKPDGTELWHSRIGGGGEGSPVIDENGSVIIATGPRTLIVSAGGDIIWKAGSDAWIDQTPAVAQGLFCYTAPWHRLRATKSDGTIAWEIDTIENVTSSPVIGNHGEIYFCCLPRLLAVQPPVALAPADSPWPMFRANARHTGRVGH